jgi:hypothetical protein
VVLIYVVAMLLLATSAIRAGLSQFKEVLSSADPSNEFSMQQLHVLFAKNLRVILTSFAQVESEIFFPSVAEPVCPFV